VLTKGVRIQLVVFAVISAFAVTFASLQYVGLPSLLGYGQYTVTADFADTSGLYPRALVTYRGTDVGEVAALDLTDEGVLVRMHIDRGVRIPADAKAEIHSTSAVGEQYIDLVPARSGAPFLTDGSQIARPDTVEMPQISPVLDSLDDLLASVPNTELSSLLHKLDQAFGGTGPALRRLLDSASLLVNDARANLGPTVGLLADLGPFLSTQQALAGETRSYVTDLASFTDQLRQSDAQIRRLIDTAPQATNAAAGLIDTVSPALPMLIANMTTVGHVTYAYIPQLRTVLTVYPAMVARVQSLLAPHADEGAAKLDLNLNYNNPPPCIRGFLPVAQRRAPVDTSPADTPSGLHCTLPSDSPSAVRGARNDPCPNGGRAATPAECGLHFSQPVATAAVPYEPSTGRFYAPDGKFYLLSDAGGGRTGDGGAPGTWQDLLTGPLQVGR
jgi:phospholipid/cholesterol/gamma-HCH transport system substrate-binding protein